jgi:hypothetical protein
MEQLVADPGFKNEKKVRGKMGLQGMSAEGSSQDSGPAANGRPNQISSRRQSHGRDKTPQMAPRGKPPPFKSGPVPGKDAASCKDSLVLRPVYETFHHRGWPAPFLPVVTADDCAVRRDLAGDPAAA